MLRHVLCVLALALCCCTSLCVAATDAPEDTVKLKLAEGEATITLTRTVGAGNCTPLSTPAPEKAKDVTISTTVTLKKEGKPPETKEMKNEPSTVVTVPDGSSVTLTTSLVFECTKKGGDSSESAEKNCLEDTATTTTNYITYDVSVKSTTTGEATVNILETEKREVKVRAGYDVKIIENVVATCIPPPTSESSLSTTQNVNSDKPQEVPNGGILPQLATNSPESPSLDGNSITTEREPQKTQDGVELKGAGPKSLDTTTRSANPNGERMGREQESDVNKDLSTPTSSEAESTATENSITVNGADHTASTATSQSETTTEGAPNTDADAPTSAGESVKPPGGNTDASSNTAWVRIPLLLLLACVAVW
ncbi:hypothetical protein DQ04_13981000 [Trypanosoma grayi]|uniref:hypothetical protein n=1 Tax=Trypanosoma grayi TaxID=71804 RepID=UPI0004F4A9AE|nr:hypothetical protein DQ04_13981000 [Trypanosoma grayi]KEG06424.1 hypothetical protein DQ04_13981000 [Trypanosoma grayi]